MVDFIDLLSDPCEPNDITAWPAQKEDIIEYVFHFINTFFLGPKY